jgi:dTDP-4-dehydrorhamnose 3,5-epimerase
MKFTATPLAGAHLVDMERLADERGFFARSFSTEEFSRHGLSAALQQCSVSFNGVRGTLRGMHYQADPDAEHKLVRCTAGAIFDVIVDLRPGSPSLHAWYGVELSADNRRALYIPPGCAHGFLTLTDAAEVFYMISAPYAPQSARGVRWNDPAFGIAWPFAPSVMSGRDAAYALLDAAP